MLRTKRIVVAALITVVGCSFAEAAPLRVARMVKVAAAWFEGQSVTVENGKAKFQKPFEIKTSHFTYKRDEFESPKLHVIGGWLGGLFGGYDLFDRWRNSANPPKQADCREGDHSKEAHGVDAGRDGGSC